MLEILAAGLVQNQVGSSRLARASRKSSAPLWTFNFCRMFPRWDSTGLPADAEALCDLARGKSAAEKLEDLQLAVAQLVDRINVRLFSRTPSTSELRMRDSC